MPSRFVHFWQQKQTTTQPTTHQHSGLNGVQSYRPQHIPKLRRVNHARAICVEQHVLALKVLQPHLANLFLELRVNLRAAGRVERRDVGGKGGGWSFFCQEKSKCMPKL